MEAETPLEAQSNGYGAPVANPAAEQVPAEGGAGGGAGEAMPPAYYPYPPHPQAMYPYPPVPPGSAGPYEMPPTAMYPHLAAINMMLPQVETGRAFILKAANEIAVHRSLKYGLWTATPEAMDILDAAFKEAKEEYPVYLLVR